MDETEEQDDRKNMMKMQCKWADEQGEMVVPQEDSKTASEMMMLMNLLVMRQWTLENDENARCL